MNKKPLIKTTSKPAGKAAAPRRATQSTTRTSRSTGKKSSDYNMHAAIIAVSVLIGLALAACTANMGDRPRRMQSESLPEPIEQIDDLMEESTTSGDVQGVTSVNVDEELKAIDFAIFSPGNEVPADAEFGAVTAQ